MEKVPFLIVTKNRPLMEILRFYLETSMAAEVVHVSDDTQALSTLRQNQKFPLIILYDYEPESYLVEDFYVYLKQHRQKVHIVILNEFFTQPAKDFFQGLHLFHLKEKEKILEEIHALAKKVYPKLEFMGEYQEYLPISIDCLEILMGLDQALFLKLPGGKFLKIFNEDDEKTALDMQKYRDKNVEFLYIQHESLCWIHLQIRKYFYYLLKDNNFKFELVDPNVEIREGRNKKIIEIIEDKYLDEDFKKEITAMMEKALKFLMNHPRVEKVLRKVDLKDDKVSYYSKKVRLMSIISCFLARELEWNSKSTIEKLIYASFLHDLTIAHNQKLLEIRNKKDLNERVDELSEKEVKIYLSHPEDGANLLDNSFNAVPFETAKLIRQHHERPDGSGFPDGVKWDKIAPLSALFIVTNDFVTYLLEDDYPTFQEYKLLVEDRYSMGIFKKVMMKMEKLKFNLPQ